MSTGMLPTGSSWSFDLYTDGSSTTWLCLEAGAVSTRVVVPVTSPTVTPPSFDHPTVGVYPGFDVTFYPDNDNV